MAETTLTTRAADRPPAESPVAFNGAGAIHDFELCYQGETSEDVQRGLDDGSFGMVDETGRRMNAALADGLARGLGAGRAGRARLSLFCKPAIVPQCA